MNKSTFATMLFQYFRKSCSRVAAKLQGWYREPFLLLIKIVPFILRIKPADGNEENTNSYTDNTTRYIPVIIEILLLERHHMRYPRIYHVNQQHLYLYESDIKIIGIS